MITALTRDAINQATDALVAVLQPEQVILFGSHAWGQPDGDSDLDIMIILSQSHLTPIQRVWQAREALKQFAFPKDILVVTRDEFDAYKIVRGSLIHDIWQRGKVLYDGQSKTTIGAELADSRPV